MVIEIDLGCRGHFRQARHGHDLAAHHDDELRAGGEPDFADIDFMTGRRAAQLASVEKEYWVLAMQTG